MPEVLVEPDPCLVSGGEVAILQEPRPAAGGRSGTKKSMKPTRWVVARAARPQHDVLVGHLNVIDGESLPKPSPSSAKPATN